MQDLNDIAFFAAVVENKGFSAAARVLGQPKSSLSRHVSQLEERLGMRLLERSTRHFRLTDAGSSYYQKARAILDELLTTNKITGDPGMVESMNLDQQMIIQAIKRSRARTNK